MNKLLVFFTIIMLGLNANSQGLETQFSYGFPREDTKDLISYNLSGDIAYMIPMKLNRKDDPDDPYDRIIGNKHIVVDMGVSAGYSYSVGKEDLDDLNFLPVAGIIRISYFKVFSFSFPLGYAISINPDILDGGIYFAPNLGISIKKVSLNLSLRGVGVDGIDFFATNIGLGYKF